MDSSLHGQKIQRQIRREVLKQHPSIPDITRQLLLRLHCITKMDLLSSLTVLPGKIHVTVIVTACQQIANQHEMCQTVCHVLMFWISKCNHPLRFPLLQQTACYFCRK